MGGARSAMRLTATVWAIYRIYSIQLRIRVCSSRETTGNSLLRRPRMRRSKGRCAAEDLPPPGRVHSEPRPANAGERAQGEGNGRTICLGPYARLRRKVQPLPFESGLGEIDRRLAGG
jgi:hypothetical protein